MASLATQLSGLDTILNPMRAITARQDSMLEMSSTDLETLQQVKEEVEHYIVEKETIRLLTTESLRLRVQNKMSGKNPLGTLRLSLAGVVALTVSITAISSFLPLGPAQNNLKQLLSPSLFFAMLYLGAAWFFIAALKELQKPVRKDYVLICIGVTIMGASQLLQPLFVILNLQKSQYMAVIITSCTIPALIVIYAGIRGYAKRLGVKSRASSGKLTTILAIAGAIIVTLVPHKAFPATPETLFKVTLAVEAIITIITIATAILMYRIQKTTSEIYAQAASKLWQALASGIFIGVYAVTMILLFGVVNKGGVVFVIAAVAFITNALLFLRAGYAFNKANIY